MIQIYFNNDTSPLDPDNYMGFSYSKKSFDKEFYLGSVSTVEASLVIPKGALPPVIDEVVVKIDNSDFLHLVVDDITINDNEEAEIKLTDKIMNLGGSYDISEYVPISAKNLLNQICEDYEISHDTFTFDNEDVVINSYDETLSAREYLSMIAELAGGYAQIDNTGKLVLKYYDNDNISNEITAEIVDSYKLSETITIERVVYEFGTLKHESDNDETKYTVHLNSDNLFLQVITDEQFEALCNHIIGFTFTNIKIPTTNIVFSNQDLINFIDLEDNEYTILNEVSAEYNGGFISSYNYNIENTKEEFTHIKTAADKINRIKITVDQAKGLVDQAITQVESLNKKIVGEYKYNLTTDTYYLANKNYYHIVDDEYKIMEEGTDYDVGDPIPPDEVYEYIYYGGLADDVDDLSTKVSNNYDEIINKFGGYATTGQLETITTQVDQIQTSTYTKTQIQQIANGTGVDGVKVEAVISTEATFDKDGMHYAKTDGITETTINNVGLEIDRISDNSLSLFAGYVENDDERFGDLYKGSSIVYTKNLIADGYTNVGGHGRFEKYTDTEDNIEGVGFYIV